jgi:orotate phosphoribosyltransferase
MPLVYHRVKAKEHGQPRAVEGRFKPGDEVVLLDDVIKSSLSKFEEAGSLAEAELTTKAVVVLVDREQGGRTELAAHDIGFAAAMTLSGIAKYALDENLAGVTPTLYDELLGELDPSELGSV